MSDNQDKFNPKVLISLVRQHMPTLLAQQVVGVQPMTTNTGSIFGVNTTFNPRPPFSVIDSSILNTGETWHTVVVNNEVYQWLQETYANHEDYANLQSNSGIIVDIPDRILVMIQLRWVE
ncbi:MAG TPA: hypothetical protein VFM18_18275 [Methanosarcina sp.]|nr:hypothetical protein [Methanosarcina sp.]